MAHIHDVYDTDPYFVIDADTRGITDLSEVKTSLMQYDHNSERITFEAPREIDAHDMSECNRVEVHYINIGTNGQRNEGVYEVDDMTVPEDDTDVVMFTWLVSQNATMHSGSLSFMIRFICTTDGAFDYVWNTAIYSGIPIGNGMDNAAVIVTQYADILGAWYNQLVSAGSQAVLDINTARDNALAQIEQAKNDTIAEAVAELDALIGEDV